MIHSVVSLRRRCREGELAVNGQAAQRRRADMEYASQDEVRILALRHQRGIGFLPWSPEVSDHCRPWRWLRFGLSAYHNAGLSVQRAKLISANALGGDRDYKLHPDGIRTLEIRSLGRLAQGVEAVLLLPGGRVGETRQLEHDP